MSNDPVCYDCGKTIQDSYEEDDAQITLCLKCWERRIKDAKP